MIIFGRSETLFQLWGSYQSRISVRMYCEKLMQLGEFLVAYEKYNIALFQCYQRYLNEFGAFYMEEFQTTDEIEEKFFPNGLSDATADISVSVTRRYVRYQMNFNELVSSFDGLCSLSILFGC